MVILALLVSGLLSHSSVGSMNLSVQEIPFKRLTVFGKFFEHQGIQWYETILFDSLKDQIILGAKDALLRLDMRLNLLEKEDVLVQKDAMQKCESSSHSEEDCHNYIPVLHELDVNEKESLLYACGTYAFNPMCFERDINNLANPQKMKTFSGENKAPQTPRYKGASASWLNANPDKNLLFIGTSLDMEAKISSIVVSEMSDKPTFKPKKVEGSLKLQNAVFAESFQIDEFVYFVFRENAVEKSANEISSRIGRVCADADAGSPDSLALSFTKVRLACGDFSSVQGISFLRTEGKLFATFSKPAQGNAKSAICMYNLVDIENAFAGDFWCQKDATSPWGVCKPRPLGANKVKTCTGERDADDLKDRILSNVTVLPYCEGPMFETTQGNVQFHALAVERSFSAYYNYKGYVGDNLSGKLWVINLGYCNQSKASEIWEVTRPDDRKISLEIVSVKNKYDSVYVLTRVGLLRYPGLNFIATTEPTSEPTVPTTVSTPPPGTGIAPIILTQSRNLGDKTTVAPENISSNVKPAIYCLMLAIISAFMILQRMHESL